MSRVPHNKALQARKDDKSEESKSGIAPYVIGGLLGVAAGLLGSYLIDKNLSAAAREEEGCSHRAEPGRCSVCLDDCSPNVMTPCCKQLLHRDCYEKYRQHNYSICPLCRKRW